MGIFKSIGKKLTHGMELSARRQVRQQLLHMSDRQLTDAGFSRVKLLEGVSAWPWAVESENDTAAKVEVSSSPRQW